jgi:DNA-directed RNA polymerase specialized sigma24 family protein
MFGSPSMKRSFLVMRNLEQLPIAEIAAVLGLTEGAVKVRNSAPCSACGQSWRSPHDCRRS